MKVPVMALAALLRYRQGTAKVACPRHSRQTAIGLDPDWKEFVHVLFDGICKLRLR
jgi:hypothetical protein